jgi:hypothetical protein
MTRSSLSPCAFLLSAAVGVIIALVLPVDRRGAVVAGLFGFGALAILLFLVWAQYQIQCGRYEERKAEREEAGHG